MRFAVIVALVLATGSFAGDAAKEKEQKILQALQGEWTLENGEYDGKPTPENYKARMLHVFEGNKMILKDLSLNRIAQTSTFTIDVTAKPMILDIQAGDTRTKLDGIFELNGDTLKYCSMFASFKDLKRPTTFRAPAGSNYFYVELKRKKKS